MLRDIGGGKNAVARLEHDELVLEQLATHAYGGFCAAATNEWLEICGSLRIVLLLWHTVQRTWVSLHAILGTNITAAPSSHIASVVRNAALDHSEPELDHPALEFCRGHQLFAAHSKPALMALLGRTRIYFQQLFGACRRRTPRARPNQRVASERSRCDASLSTLQNDGGPSAFAVGMLRDH